MLELLIIIVIYNDIIDIAKLIAIIQYILKYII